MQLQGFNTVKYITIPAGTILYRSAPNICEYSKNIPLQKRQCTNTGKCGVYFSTYLFQSLTMAIEYNTDLELGEFITTENITVSVGKYSFRYINPKRYFQYDMRDNTIRMKLHIPVTSEEDVSHFNSDMLPIVRFVNNSGNYIDYNIDHFSKSLKPTDGELFITNDDVLKSVTLLKTYKINVKKLKNIVRDNIDNLHPYSYEFYKNALSKIKCDDISRRASRRTSISALHGGKHTMKRVRR